MSDALRRALITDTVRGYVARLPTDVREKLGDADVTAAASYLYGIGAAASTAGIGTSAQAISSALDAAGGTDADRLIAMLFHVSRLANQVEPDPRERRLVALGVYLALLNGDDAFLAMQPPAGRA